jgi:hypothetical protein
VVVVVVVGTVVVLAGAVVEVGAVVVLVVVVVVELEVSLVLAAPAPVAGRQAMAATTALTVTRTGPHLSIAGVPRRPEVVSCSCRGPPPAMAIDWRIPDGARCASPYFSVRSGSAG